MAQESAGWAHLIGALLTEGKIPWTFAKFCFFFSLSFEVSAFLMPGIYRSTNAH